MCGMRQKTGSPLQTALLEISFHACGRTKVPRAYCITGSAMSMGNKVICVGPAALDFIFDPIVAGLRQRGHEVVYYTGYSQFERESTAALASAGVLVAVGSFPCTRELMVRAPQLRALVSPFIGTEGFDETAATALG